MCYSTAKDKDLDKANKGKSRPPAKKKDPEKFKPGFKLNAFTNDYLPVFRATDVMEFFSWGFIQPSSQDDPESAEIKRNTANAKVETIFEKNLYRKAIFERRCLIMVDGFYEWRHEFKKTYPYFIQHANEPVLYMAGIWNEWANPDTGEIKETVSMLTTAANPLMQVIHNKKHRQPLILDNEIAFDWLGADLKETHLKELMQPFKEEKMKAYTIGKKLDNDSPDTLKPVTYPELENTQQSLF